MATIVDATGHWHGRPTRRIRSVHPHKAGRTSRGELGVEAPLTPERGSGLILAEGPHDLLDQHRVDASSARTERIEDRRAGDPGPGRGDPVCLTRAGYQRGDLGV